MTGPDDTDPRMQTRYVATVDGTDGETDKGAVTLVGVVHDHPASVYRARRVAAERDPDVLALELPPLAVPLYESHATGGNTPPAHGGELSAAVQAAETDDVVGIDGPSVGFVEKLARRLVRDRASPRTVARLLRSLASVSGSALACRLAGVVTARTPLRVTVGSPTPHGTTWLDSAGEQADDERHQIRTATAVMDAFETAPSSQYRSESRERHMADRLAALRERGDVVAVVGAGHFDALCDRLDTDD
jgi:pheromone shutdown protein TraB